MSRHMEEGSCVVLCPHCPYHDPEINLPPDWAQQLEEEGYAHVGPARDILIIFSDYFKF